MGVYYNEHDPKAAAWLRELIKGGHIAAGVVDERSIVDVKPDDLAGYTQCHFFAGIGGWSYALRLAGWADDRSVWTGSCPCQPFSAVGKRRGPADPRHLWPEFFRLISQCKPSVVFGEQIAGGGGPEWLAGVRADLEGAAYAVGAANLPAGGFGAPHKRERLWFVAVGNTEGIGRRYGVRAIYPPAGSRTEARQSPWASSAVSGADGTRRRVAPGHLSLAHGIPGRVGLLRGYGNAIVPQVAAAFIEAYREIA